MLPGQKFEMPDIYPHVFVGVVSYLSFFFIWLNPFKLLATFPLVLPLFFIDDLTQMNWYLYLLIGLGAILWFYQDQKSLAPHFLLMGTVMIVLAILGTIVTPRTFFYRPLNLYFNESKNTQFLNSFNLSQVGYSNSPSGFGGPVTINNNPFMIITGPNISMYLKGSSYTEFENNRWVSSNRVFEPVDVFELSPTPNRPELSNLYLPASYLITPIVRPINSLFYSGDIHYVRSGSDFEILRDQNDSLIFDQNMESDYGVLSMVNSPSNLAFHKLVVESPNLLLSKGEPSYRLRDSNVLASDATLYNLVYEQFDQQPTLINLYSIIEHFRNEYSYTLDVSVPRDYNNQFSNTLATFFDDKEGYCVYFASALTLLLQDLGFEARYTEGFLSPGNQSQDIVETVITNAQAHAWTEIYLDGLGWFVIDATPTSHISTLTQPEAPSVNTPVEPDEMEIPDLDIEIEQPDNPEPEITPETTIPQPQPETETVKPMNWIWIWVLLMGLFVLIQFRRFNNRHDPERLNQRLLANEKQTILELYKDLQRIYGLSYTDDLPLNSVSRTVNQIVDRHHLLKTKQLDYAIRAINDALYNPNPSHPLTINALVQLYFRLEKASKTQSNKIKYNLFRILFNFH